MAAFFLAQLLKPIVVVFWRGFCARILQAIAVPPPLAPVVREPRSRCMGAQLERPACW
jgi:hypothetical protein